MMQALAAILDRPKTVLTLMLVLITAGAIAYVTVPKDANPDIDIPVFYVSISQAGISPEDAERLLVRPMETQLRSLEGLKEISATASEGHAGIVLEFTADFDKDAAMADVRDKVDLARGELPADADEPRIFETNFSLIPTIIVTLSGSVPERTLYARARSLKDQIEAISTVLSADLVGHREELLEVNINLSALESYNITQPELIRAVTQNNRLVPAGALDTGAGRFNVKVPGLFETAGDVFELPVKVDGDAVVRLGDLATISRTFKDATGFSRFNGEPTIAIQVVKRIGTNIVSNNEAVRQAVAEFTADWPDAIEVGFTLDQSEFIFEVLGSLQSAILTAIALVMIIVVAALGMRSALLVGIAIPTSFMIGFLLVGLLGMTVNMMVMFGLVLTVGMLVDGTIVIVEYADRKMAEGLEKRTAYTLAAQRMFWPVVSSTATTLAAFLPMLMWPGTSGEFMSYLPVMVVIVLSASLVTAMIFLPVLGGIFGRTVATAQETDTARKLSGTAKFDYREIPGLTGIYVRFLAVVIRHPAKLLVLALILFSTIIMAFARYNNGVEFFVDEEPREAVVLVSARGNLSALEERDLVIEVEREVLAIDGVRNLFFSSGRSSAGGISPNDVQDRPADLIGQMTMELEPVNQRRKAKLIFAEIRQRTEKLAGVRVEIREIEGGPPTGKHVRLEISATNYDVVREVTARVRRHFEDGIAGLIDIEDSRPLPGIEWEINVDRAEAGRYGTDVASVGAMIQLVTNGLLIGNYRPDDSDDEVDIRLRLPEDQRSIDQLDQLRIQTPMGLVPISNFVSRSAEPKVSAIGRANGRFAMLVKANAVEGILPDTKVREVDEWIKAQTWPPGVQFRFRGADEEQKEAGEFLGKAAIAALFLMFIILLTQFNSFYQTALTLSTVLMSTMGVLLGMIITGQTFSIIMTGTGIVALAGIVVNNAIVLMDTFNRLRASGLNTIDAVLRTSAQRIRPILLTTVTTIMGLVPMALMINIDFFNRTISQGGITAIWWVQLSTAVIFGLAFSTLLTLILIPTLLAMPEVYALQYRSWRARRAAKRGVTPVAEPVSPSGSTVADPAE
ncbi:RND efflux system, inner membrane transporter [hydrothermal vent metagenome]|uniref:RND efflux system, inner membrane transporter n=1 Tax=hydrothermal vent metagenome TaxID=652676 RepID=A0A3B0TMR5_9ZZZZ